MPNRLDIIMAAREWIGVRWQHQGRTIHGIDCVGLILKVGQELKLVDFDTTNYQRRTHGTLFLKHFKEHMKQKPILEGIPGDVLLLRDAQYPCHSTIIGERNNTQTIIHAHALKRKVLEEPLNQGDWLDKRVACFEFIGVED